MVNADNGTARRFMLLGAVLVMVGLLTGFISGNLANPRMGLSAHLAGVMGGIMMLALGAGWQHVQLGATAERWALSLLAFGNIANWATVLLAAIWGAGRTTMPLAAGEHVATAWQENLVGILLVALSLAMVAGIALVIKGLLAKAK
jgi:(hydroxyamino)benzene mutase